MILLVEYPGLSWRDVLSYDEMVSSMVNQCAFYPRVLEFPSCKHCRTAAHCEQRGPGTITITWKDNETNKKNDIDLGVLTLTWFRQEDVLKSSPNTVKWEEEGGYVCYPIPTLVR